MAGQDRGMGRTTEDGSLKGGRAYWYGPALTEEEELERDRKTRENSQGEDWRPEDEEENQKDIEGLIEASNKIIAENGENSSKEEISSVLHGIINVLNGKDTGGLGTRKEEMDIFRQLTDIFKTIS